jgi:hypothetical protein
MQTDMEAPAVPSPDPGPQGFEKTCYDMRGWDLDTLFAVLPNWDRCVDARQRAQARFSPHFPGWALYRRLITGDPLLDRTLEAWAIGMARGLARARKINGRAVVPAGTRRNDWIAQAGRDGLDGALFGRFPCGVGVRAERFHMRAETYQRVRDAVADGICRGAAHFQSEIHFQYRRLGYGN